MIQVAICDDHQLFREGIRFLLERMPNIDFRYEAGNGEELIRKLEEEHPDVLLLDLEMPDMDGVEALKQIRTLYPDLGVIILTTYSDSKMVAYLMELGANSYLLKDTDAETLQRGIQSVFHEGYYFTREVSKAMLTGLKGNSRKKPELKNNVTISEREQEVLELICQEYTTKEIADKLFISSRTAEGHRKNLIEKLGVKNTAGLIVKSIRLGIIEV